MSQTARDAERRAALRLTDDILEELEQLNLEDAAGVPEPLTEALRRIGVEDPRRHTLPQLISIVLDKQRRYLRGGGAGPERRMPSATSATSAADRRA